MSILSKCRISGRDFQIEDEDLAFYHKVSPVFGEQRLEIPPPTLSPLERHRRRLSFRNLRNLYHRSCELSGRKIISMYSPDSPVKVYHSDEWWSDAWDPLAYGRPFDFSRPFFEQFADLLAATPMLHAYVILSENCEYINGAANCKDCYLSFNMDYCEQCLYANGLTHSTSCVDCLNLSRSEICYECVDCQNCYGLLYSERCISCYDSCYLTDCRQCRNCVGCSNLVNQENCLFNRKVSAQEIAQAKLKLTSRTQRTIFADQAMAHALRYPKKYYFGHSNENFSGYNLHHARNSYDCFECFEIENCKHCDYVFQANNCMDYTIFGDHSQWIYECLATGLNASNDLFCIGCWGGSNYNLYCHTVSACSNCFGCISLRHKQYCILNTQYSKNEYDALVPKIILHLQNTGEWGEFFPAAISPFAYNETIAGEYFPLNKSEAAARGYKWRNLNLKKAAAVTYSAPETIAEVSEKIVQQVMLCPACGSNFKIIAKEFSFYKSWNVPIPDECPECRHKKRRARSVPFELWNRACAKCGTTFQTPFPAQRKEILCCEQCYQANEGAELMP